MKSITTCIVLLLGLTLFLPSCTIEKRLYNKGFHVTKKGGKKPKSDKPMASKQEVAREENLSSAEESIQTTTTKYEVAASPTFESDAIQLDETITINKASESSIPAETRTIEATDTKTSPIPQRANAENKILKKHKGKSNSDSDENSSSGTLAGALIIALGLALLLFVSILVGIIIMIVGLIVLIVGNSNSSEKAEEKEPLQDVVYLKNGSVIRGTIIEQVPSVSLKIQTRDGSIFVYKMEEVEKMTKEPSK